MAALEHPQAAGVRREIIKVYGQLDGKELAPVPVRVPACVTDVEIPVTACS